MKSITAKDGNIVYPGAIVRIRSQSRSFFVIVRRIEDDLILYYMDNRAYTLHYDQIDLVGGFIGMFAFSERQPLGFH